MFEVNGRFSLSFDTLLINLIIHNFRLFAPKIREFASNFTPEILILLRKNGVANPEGMLLENFEKFFLQCELSFKQLKPKT